LKPRSARRYFTCNAARLLDKTYTRRTASEKEGFAYRVGLFTWVVLLWAAIGSFLYGIGLFAFQIAYWMYSGRWQELPVAILFVRRTRSDSGPEILVIRFLDAFEWEWLLAPQSWFGFHKIVLWFLQSSLASALVLLAVLFLCLNMWLGNLAAMNPSRKTIAPVLKPND
jgi:hypothetical protein